MPDAAGRIPRITPDPFHKVGERCVRHKVSLVPAPELPGDALRFFMILIMLFAVVASLAQLWR